MTCAGRTPDSVEELSSGDHVCCLYETDAEHKDLLSRFLRAGLERGEKILYIIDARAVETIRGYLRDAGIDAKACEEKGRIAILGIDNTYTKGGSFDPDPMIELLRTETRKALREGYAALRVTAEMTWALRGLAGSERLMEYEAKLDRFFPGQKCLAVCQYDMHRFGSDILLDVLSTHPIAIVGTEYYRNPYYIPPKDCLGPDPARAALRHRIAFLAENKRAEETLREEESRFRQLFCTVPDAVFVIDRETGNIVDVNEVAERMYGYTREEWLRMKNTDVSAEPEETRRATRELPPAIPLRHHRRKDGTVFPAEMTVGSFVRKGRVFIIATGRDITERMRTEDEKLSLEKRLNEAQKHESLGILAGGIAHDFNNLLMGILGYADLTLLEIPAESPILSNVQNIRAAALRLAELTRQMLAYSGKGKFVVEPINLSRLIEEMVHLLKVVISKKAVIKLNLMPDIPAILADAGQIRQVVMNLIINASEAIGEKSGVIAISTGMVSVDSEYLSDVFLGDALDHGYYVYVEISDTGCGMGPEVISKIFDPFFTTKFTGRGLGLAAVLGIVRGHSGGIKVYSEPRRGTTFKLLFPSAGQTETVSPGQVEAGEVTQSGTILVVDDEETVCAVAKMMLERVGFNVLTAEDGRQAMKLMCRYPGPIACVLLDLTMPHMDGVETFRVLRHLYPDLPVILSSGYNEQDAISHFSGKGLASFIQKPYESKSLIEKIQAVLKKKRA